MRPFLAALALLASAASARAGEAPELSAMIARVAASDGVPAGLVERVVEKESGFNPRAHTRRYWGLMQIRPDTARALGYRGRPEGLLDPQTNLTYGVLYLSNAWRVSGGQESKAMRLYADGYYFEAKRRGRLALIRTASVVPPTASSLAR